MDIRLGMRVFTSDGQHIGSVDRVILEPDSREVFGIIAHKGPFFTEDRIIEVGFIERVVDDAIQLRIARDKADELPRFVEHDFVVPTPEQLRTIPYPVDGGVSGAGATMLPLLWRSTYKGHDFKPASRFFLESTPVDEPAVEILSNLPDDALVVDRGTEVISKDGIRIGTVDDVIVVDGVMSGFLVRAGVFHHQDLSVPVQMIDSITPEHIRLTVSAEDVKSRPDARSTIVNKTTG
jgi:uncharacterized protein YrrD